MEHKAAGRIFLLMRTCTYGGTSHNTAQAPHLRDGLEEAQGSTTPVERLADDVRLDQKW